MCIRLLSCNTTTPEVPEDSRHRREALRELPLLHDLLADGRARVHVPPARLQQVQGDERAIGPVMEFRSKIMKNN